MQVNEEAEKICQYESVTCGVGRHIISRKGGVKSH
jgi:hypothetical protein